MDAVYADGSALVSALAERGVEVGGADGLNIWVPVHDEAAALVRLASDGIGVTPGRAFLLVPDYPDHVRVTSGVVPEKLAAAVAESLAAAANSAGWRSRAR